MHCPRFLMGEELTPLYSAPSCLSNRKRFPCLHSLIKHERGWENWRQFCKPSTSSRVCIIVENSPNSSSYFIRLCKHRKKALYCFYKMTSFKNYSARKDKRFILSTKTYLPTTLICQWDFSTNQSKLKV